MTGEGTKSRHTLMAAFRSPHPRARARNPFGYHPPIRRITPHPSQPCLPILGT
jgi:hypothetical protein